MPGGAGVPGGAECPAGRGCPAGGSTPGGAVPGGAGSAQGGAVSSRRTGADSQQWRGRVHPAPRAAGRGPPPRMTGCSSSGASVDSPSGTHTTSTRASPVPGVSSAPVMSSIAGHERPSRPPRSIAFAPYRILARPTALLSALNALRPDDPGSEAAMATAEECREAFEKLRGQSSPSWTLKTARTTFSGRSFSCHVSDLDVTFVTRFGPSGADPVHGKGRDGRTPSPMCGSPPAATSSWNWPTTSVPSPGPG